MNNNMAWINIQKHGRNFWDGLENEHKQIKIILSLEIIEISTCTKKDPWNMFVPPNHPMKFTSLLIQKLWRPNFSLTMWIPKAWHKLQKILEHKNNNNKKQGAMPYASLWDWKMEKRTENFPKKQEPSPKL